MLLAQPFRGGELFPPPKAQAKAKAKAKGEGIGMSSLALPCPALPCQSTVQSTVSSYYQLLRTPHADGSTDGLDSLFLLLPGSHFSTLPCQPTEEKKKTILLRHLFCLSLLLHLFYFSSFFFSTLALSPTRLIRSSPRIFHAPPPTVDYRPVSPLPLPWPVAHFPPRPTVSTAKSCTES